METVHCSIPVLSNIKLQKHKKKKTRSFSLLTEKVCLGEKRGNNNKWTDLFLIIFHTVMTQ